MSSLDELLRSGKVQVVFFGLASGYTVTEKANRVEALVNIWPLQGDLI
jgi:hypothetical protein